MGAPLPPPSMLAGAVDAGGVDEVPFVPLFPPAGELLPPDPVELLPPDPVELLPPPPSATSIKEVTGIAEVNVLVTPLTTVVPTENDVDTLCSREKDGEGVGD